MTQAQFMYKLMVELGGVPDEDKYVLMNDYTQYFSEQSENGLTEEMIIDSLRSPQEIAECYKKGKPIPLDGSDVVKLNGEDVSSKTPLSVFKFILMFPVAVLYVPITFAVSLVAVVLTFALCIASVCLSVFSFTVATLNKGFILLGVGGIFFTIAFIMLCIPLFQASAKLVLMFPRFMKKVLNNEV